MKQFLFISEEKDSLYFGWYKSDGGVQCSDRTVQYQKGAVHITMCICIWVLHSVGISSIWHLTVGGRILCRKGINSKFFPPPPVLDATGELSFNDENGFNLNNVSHIISYLTFLRNHTGPALPTHMFLLPKLWLPTVCSFTEVKFVHRSQHTEYNRKW